MSSPVYFFPAKTLKDLFVDSVLASSAMDPYGLADILGDTPIGRCSRTDMTSRGPGDKSGCLLCVNTQGKPPHRFGYYPEFQTWTCVRNTPPLWLGVDKEYPPTPTDLQRDTLVPGHKVRLCDGHEYELPVIRSPQRGSMLPQDMVFDADGNFQVVAKPENDELWKLTEAVWDVVVGDGAITFPEILERCLRFLGVNYRYGRNEHAVLRLVDTAHARWEGIFAAVLDMPFVEQAIEAQKKTESQPVPVTPSTEPGAEDSAAATDQAAANST